MHAGCGFLILGMGVVGERGGERGGGVGRCVSEKCVDEKYMMQGESDS